MEEEIDLRPYIEALIEKWYWIIGAAILTGIAAFAVSSFLPPVYEATALVVVVEPENIVQFDDRIRQINEPQPLSAFPQLALSDELLQGLLVQQIIEEVSSVEDLRQLLEASLGEDNSVIQLKATSQSKVDAADLVNTWANLFVVWANDIYGASNQEQVRFFEARLEDAEADLSEAETALIEYQSVNEQLLVSNILQSYNEKQSNYLVAQQTVEQLLRDVEALMEQLASQETSSSVNLADQLTAFQLQLQTYNSVSESNTSIPLVQVSLDSGFDLTSGNRDSQIALLESLHTTLVSQLAQIEVELETLAPEILSLQRQKQEAETEYNRLIRNHTVAEETYTALARKVEEERITSQDTRSGVRLASEAAVPERPLSKNRLINTAIAGSLAFFFVAIAITLSTWWRLTREQETQ